MTFPPDELLWSALCAAEAAFFEARMALLRGASDMPSLLSRALQNPSQRGSALRILQLLPEQSVRQHASELVALASVGHSDVSLVRDVILRIDHDWLKSNVDALAQPLLVQAGEEEFRRLAELYELLDETLLDAHLARCAAHQEEQVLQIAEDYRTRRRVGVRNPM